MADFVPGIFGSDTNGQYAIVEVITPPGGGPPRHSHSNENERFLVLEGVYLFWIADADPVAVHPGAPIVFGPRNVFHRFQNISEGLGRMLLIFTPGGCEQYFVDLAEARQRLNGTELLEAEEAIDLRYGITINRRA